MPTFLEVYRERHHCTAEQFHHRVLRDCLYPHARLLAPAIRLFNYDFFAADRALISCVAAATTVKRVREEVRDFFWDSNNRGWLRRTVNIRVSGQRLKNLARHYLPEGTATPFSPHEGSNPPM